MKVFRRVCVAAIAVACVFPLAAQTIPSAGKTTAQKFSRAADGHPDLQGIWTNATLSPLERPGVFKGRPSLNDAEAKAYEKQTVENVNSDQRGATAESDRDHAYNALFFDRGSELARVDGVKRTSLIIDPPEGTLPPLTAEARQKMAARARAAESFSGADVRPLGERCLVGFGSTSGPPMLPVLYNNNYQIVQTPEAIMILVEMVHDVRVIRMNGSSHPPSGVRLWLGDSTGRWEGDTLVVDTTNFTEKTRFRGSGTNLHVVERFTPVDSGTMLYRATVDDPASFTRPFTLEYPLRATAGPVYEYACHEGNYAMTDILGGARKDQAAH